MARTTVTVAAAFSLITPSALTWMSACPAAAAPTQPARIHLGPSLVSAWRDTGGTVLPVRMWMNARRLSSATPVLCALTFQAPTTVLVRWVILEMGYSNAGI